MIVVCKVFSILYFCIYLFYLLSSFHKESHAAVEEREQNDTNTSYFIFFRESSGTAMSAYVCVKVRMKISFVKARRQTDTQTDRSVAGLYIRTEVVLCYPYLTIKHVLHLCVGVC